MDDIVGSSEVFMSEGNGPEPSRRFIHTGADQTPILRYTSKTSAHLKQSTISKVAMAPP